MVESILPSSYEEVLVILKNNKVTLMAGGTDLMVKKRNWSALAPLFDCTVLFLDKVEALRGILKQGNQLHIGSLTTLDDLLQHMDTPILLKKAICLMASPGIRHTGTIGGNIGNASPAGDTLPILYLLNAKLVLASLEGERILGIEEFIKGPGKTVMEPQELIKEILLEDTPFDLSSYEKIGGRKSDAISKVSFCAGACLKEDLITDFRMAFGAVGPTVVRSKGREAQLIGKSILHHREELLALLTAYGEELHPIDDQRSSARYRKECAMNLAEGFLDDLYVHYLKANEKSWVDPLNDRR